MHNVEQTDAPNETRNLDQKSLKPLEKYQGRQNLRCKNPGRKEIPGDKPNILRASFPLRALASNESGEASRILAILWV